MTANASQVVLVVDDDVRVLRLLDDAVQSLGYRVITAATGEAALAQGQAETPDLVLLDLRLPDMTGAAVLDALLARHPDLPVVVLSGDFSDEDKAKLRRASGVIQKPVDLTLLLGIVRQMLQRGDG
jgi:DNA-binding response OmpR family regulator